MYRDGHWPLQKSVVFQNNSSLFNPYTNFNVKSFLKTHQPKTTKNNVKVLNPKIYGDLAILSD